MSEQTQTTQLLVAFMVSLPGILVALGTLIVAWRTQTVVNQVKVQTDGMSSALVKAERNAGMAQGTLEERARGDVRADAAAARSDGRAAVAASAAAATAAAATAAAAAAAAAVSAAARRDRDVPLPVVAPAAAATPVAVMNVPEVTIKPT